MTVQIWLTPGLRLALPCNLKRLCSCCLSACSHPQSYHAWHLAAPAPQAGLPAPHSPPPCDRDTKCAESQKCMQQCGRLHTTFCACSMLAAPALPARLPAPIHHFPVEAVNADRNDCPVQAYMACFPCYETYALSIACMQQRGKLKGSSCSTVRNL